MVKSRHYACNILKTRAFSGDARSAQVEGCHAGRFGGEVFRRTHHAERRAYSGRKQPIARQRAWRELQAIRQVFALVIDDLPPPPKPASSEAEGALLRAALAKAITEPWRRLAELEAAIRAANRPLDFIERFLRI